MSRDVREFHEYSDAEEFRDERNGTIEWCEDRGKQYWLVWYESEDTE